MLLTAFLLVFPQTIFIIAHFTISFFLFWLNCCFSGPVIMVNLVVPTRLWLIIVLVFVMIVNIAIVGPPSLQIRLKLSLSITLVLLTITTRVTATTTAAAA